MTALSNRRIRQLNRQADAVAALTVTVAARGGWVVVSGETAYCVTIAGDGQTDWLECDCTAGQFGRACKHKAAVAGYIVAHPAPVAPPADPIDPAERYIARDRAAAQARGRLPWTVGVNEER